MSVDYSVSKGKGGKVVCWGSRCCLMSIPLVIRSCRAGQAHILSNKEAWYRNNSFHFEIWKGVVEWPQHILQISLPFPFPLSHHSSCGSYIPVLNWKKLTLSMISRLYVLLCSWFPSSRTCFPQYILLWAFFFLYFFLS